MLIRSVGKEIMEKKTKNKSVSPTLPNPIAVGLSFHLRRPSRLASAQAGMKLTSQWGREGQVRAADVIK